MKFNDLGSDKQGIVPDTYFLLFGDSSDHSADYPLADLARNANRWYDKVTIKILQADKRFEWDDTNKTDLPIAKINIVSGQNDYGVSAATYLKVSRVEARDSQGNRILLDRFTLDDVTGRAFGDMQAESGTPSAYMLRGSSLFFDKTPNYSYTEGLRVFYQRNVDYFASTDTTKVPGFAEPFHRLLSLGAALEYAVAKGMKDKQASLRADIASMEQDLVNFYATRNDSKVSLRTSRSDYGESSAMGGRPSRQDSFNI